MKNSETTYIERSFKQISSVPPDKTGVNELQPFSDLLPNPAIVLLGKPGDGKSRSFREEANREGALYVDIRDFITLDLERYRGRTLFLDALDEIRAGQGVSEALDKVRQRLDELDRPSFRLSCRTADWYGPSDASRLAKVSLDGSLVVVQLEDLTKSDIRAITSEHLSDPEAFIEEAEKRDLFELLQNPLTLELVIEVVKEGGWPTSRRDLYEKSCEVLIREKNEVHERAHQTFPDNVLKSAAGLMFSVVLLGGKAGIALSRVQANINYPFIEELGGTSEELNVAARRRVFSSIGAEKVVPLHRSIAEFLAAKYLVDKIEEGFPLGRLLALMSGLDNRVVNDLRGLFAWLTCMLPSDRIEPLIAQDPFGIVLNGDISILSASSKRKMLEALDDLEQRDPYYLSGHWSSASGLGGISTPDMFGEIEAILKNPVSPPSLTASILLAILHGQTLPGIQDVLLELISRKLEYERDFLRPMALKALLSICSPKDDMLIQLLNDINESKINDENCEMRGLLLDYLYPKSVGVDELADYIVSPSESFFGQYNRFILFDLINNSSVNDHPKLLDSCVEKIPIQRRHDDYTLRNFYGNLLLACLENQGDKVDAKTIYRWLCISLDQYDSRFMEMDHQGKIRQWLEDNPLIFLKLIAYWAVEEQSSDTALWMSWNKFNEAVQRAHFPVGFREILLDIASNESDLEKAQFLIGQAIHFLSHFEREDDLTMEQINHFIKQNPHLRTIVDEEMKSPLPEWHFEQSIKSHQREEQIEQKRKFRVKNYSERIEAITLGEDLTALEELGKTYWGMFIECDSKQNPIERIQSLTSDTIAQAATVGFNALLQKEDLPSPQDIGKTYAKDRHYRIGYPLLAGLDCIASSSNNTLLTLPQNTLRCAIVLILTHPVGETPDWYKYLLGEKAGLAINALEQFLRPLFEVGSKDLMGLHLLRNEHLKRISGKTVLALLGDYPACSEMNLGILLSVGLQWGDRDELLALANRFLKDPPSLDNRKQLYWLIVAFLLDSEKYKADLDSHIQSEEELLGLLISFILESITIEPFYSLSLETIHDVIEIFTSAIPYKSTDFIFERNFIRLLLEILSTSDADEADERLELLRDNPNLREWQGTFSHEIERRLKRKRDDAFEHPTLEQVIDLLNGGPPVNNIDFQALIYEHLCEIATEIRHGASNPYKNFWNVDRWGKATDPRHENVCRDRLMEMLIRKVSGLGINIEPEGSYAEDKRADIKVLSRKMNLPVEIKRDIHKDLWTAIQDQLQKYTKDPGAGNRGIYLVFWFGGGGMPTPPEGIDMPEAPQELEQAVRMTIPAESTHLISVIVIDVSKIRD